MLKITNTLSGEKEDFKPRQGKQINLFVCGPTVYDLSHIGHARTYIAFDVIVKYLRQVGFDVFYLQNITDVDDKIIERAKLNKEGPRDLAKHFETDYFADMESLGVDSVSEYARATDHIEEILSQTERLLEKGYAYEIEEDGIYFDIAKFKDYGKLSHRTAEQAEDATSRIDESVQKRNKGDFALWKLAPHTPTGGAAGGFASEPKWDSPWGSGRPGWHIEDTAITEKHFGAQYDIHGGARDLIFPHHEAEISQMEAISGKEPLAAYWMHSGFLVVEGEKMSKSLGNFITIRDFLQNHPARVLRLLVAKTHYRSPIDYSAKMVEQTKNELARIDEFVDKISDSESSFGKDMLQKARKNVEKAMEDDFNTPAAMAAVFELIREANAQQAYSKDILDFLKEIDEFFGFIFWGKEEIEIPEEIKKLADEREQYRKEENWEKSDEVRKQMEQKGWVVEDTPNGPKFKKLD